MAIILPKQVWTEEGKLLFQKSEKVTDFDRGKEIVKSLSSNGNWGNYAGWSCARPKENFCPPCRSSIYIFDSRKKFGNILFIGRVVNPIL